jgi:formylglycine-generating enzyme required for sulfatase activity
MRGPNGRNYLVPVKSVIESDDHIRVRAVPVDDLLDELGNTDDQLRIVVLDACRNNPFADRKKGDGTMGLSRPTQRAGTLLAFATGDGKTAADGQEGNSPYAQALAQRLRERADVKEVFDRVAEEVYDKTRRSQRPMKVDDVLGKHYLAGRPPTPGSATQVASVVPEPGNPTARPGQSGGLSLDDLEKEETTRKEWAAWQARMKADYDKTASFGGSADLRVKAWERFLGNYGQDNPLSREDEALRAQARQRQEGAQGEARRQAAVQVQPPATQSAPVTATPTAGQAIKDCADCPEMVVIPAGSFQMGSNDGYADEKPVHSVTLKSFALGKYEVTQGQWKAVMGSNPSKFSSCGDTCSVEQVSWEDIQQYIQKLNTKSGQQYRLPSESEWEYAARAGSTGKWSFGSDEGQTGQNAWYSANSNSSTQKVGQKKPNAFGLYDMYGNVWEWVQDYYHDSYSGVPTDGSPWESGGEQKYRVLRGGGWIDGPAGLRSANRSKSTPGFPPQRRFPFSQDRAVRRLPLAPLHLYPLWQVRMFGCWGSGGGAPSAFELGISA